MNDKINEFMIWAEDNGWTITTNQDHQLHLAGSLLSRYKEIPNDYLEFLSVVKRCSTPDEKTWFLCEDEYNNRSDTDFKWNEFEMLSFEENINNPVDGHDRSIDRTFCFLLCWI